MLVPTRSVTVRSPTSLIAVTVHSSRLRTMSPLVVCNCRWLRRVATTSPTATTPAAIVPITVVSVSPVRARRWRMVWLIASTCSLVAAVIATVSPAAWCCVQMSAMVSRCSAKLPGMIRWWVSYASRARRTGDLVNPSESVKHALRSLATRWLMLSTEIGAHDEALDTITLAAAPSLREAFGIGPDSAAEMMIVAGDNPQRVRSEAAFAKLCGTCPIPASSGVTNRHRLFRGGHRQANAALYRIVIVRMRWHQPTIDYVTRRSAQGLSKKDIIRCLKRFVACEIYNALITDHQARVVFAEAA